MDSDALPVFFWDKLKLPLRTQDVKTKNAEK